MLMGISLLQFGHASLPLSITFPQSGQRTGFEEAGGSEGRNNSTSSENGSRKDITNHPHTFLFLLPARKRPTNPARREMMNTRCMSL